MMLFRRWKIRSRLTSLKNSFLKDSSVRVSTHVAETGALLFVMTSAVLTYLYGTFLVLPVVLAEYPSFIMFFCTVLTTWIFACVCANMYLVRKRNSSIRNRMLMQPVVKPLSTTISGLDSDLQCRETAKHVGEHFTPNPFGEDHNWHICAACEVFVPPRCWHCHVCNTCILRRDHHCIFTGCCIGEENQGNFLSLLFYLGCGTTISAVVSYIYSVYFENMTVWWYLFRMMGMVYSVFFDFQITMILASISTMGQMASWGVFLFYFATAMRGQTSADVHRKILRTNPGEHRYSFKNLREFLGPNPIIRILWPFHTPFKVNYSPQVFTEDDRYRMASSYSPYYFKQPDHVLGYECKASYNPHFVR